MSLYGKHHRTRAEPDGTCPHCGAQFPVDSMRDQHVETCNQRPQEDQ